ncbi:MAG: TIGR04086 family membrane protein [Candidatus Fimadaptatus sp.]
MNTGKRNDLLGIARGIAAAAAITLAGMLALGLAAGYTGITDDAIQTLNQCLKLVSVIAGALLAVRMGGQRGMLKGALVGALYMLLGLALVGALTATQPDWKVLLSELAISAAIGAASGVLAANLPERKHRRVRKESHA